MLREIDWSVERTDVQIECEWRELIPKEYLAAFMQSSLVFAVPLLDPVSAYFAADMIGAE